MCTLHLFFRVFPGESVLFASNRDELLSRPWARPGVLSEHPWIFGPRDTLAGGTWLGLNEFGVLAALANHYGTLRSPESESLCSRGAVVIDALLESTADRAAARAERGAPACKSYTLLIAGPDAAFVVERTPQGTACVRLEPGCHVITNARFRDPQDPRARRALRRMRDIAGACRSPTDDDVRDLLSDHGSDAVGATPVCVHPEPGSHFGTSSASIVRIVDGTGPGAFLFAPGPPCVTPFSRQPVPRPTHGCNPAALQPISGPAYPERL